MRVVNRFSYREDEVAGTRFVHSAELVHCGACRAARALSCVSQAFVKACVMIR